MFFSQFSEICNQQAKTAILIVSLREAGLEPIRAGTFEWFAIWRVSILRPHINIFSDFVGTAIAAGINLCAPQGGTQTMASPRLNLTGQQRLGGCSSVVLSKKHSVD